MRPIATFSPTSANRYFKNLKVDFGAVGDGITDDTGALNSAAAAFSGGSSIFMPAGTYKTTTGITLSTLNPNAGQKWVGEGFNRSIIAPTGAGMNAITLTGSIFRGHFEDFGISGASNTGAGILSPSTTQIYNSVWRNLYIAVGGDGIQIGNHFSHMLEQIWIVGTGNGNCFALAGGNTVLLLRCYATCGSQQSGAGVSGTLMKAGYRIAGAATLISCNGLDSGDYWGVFGSRAAATGTAQGGASTTITLAAVSFGANDAIKGFKIVITGGKGAGQTGLCSAWNDSTKVATVTTAWTTIPDATSTYSVQDQESLFNYTQYVNVHLIGCNIENCQLDGIRLLNEPSSTSGFIMDNCSFQQNSGLNPNTFNSMLHLYNGAVTRPHTLRNVSFSNGAGATRAQANDIICDFPSAYLLCQNTWPEVTSGAANQFTYISSGATGLFNHITPSGISLPNIPAANPADGSKSLYVGAGGVVTQGT